MHALQKSQNVALGIGSNLGVPLDNIEQARRLLEQGGLKDIVSSSLIITEPVDCVPGTPDFTNAVFTGYWDGTPRELLSLCQDIEITIGRPEDHRQDEARLIDVDLLLFEERVIDSEDFVVPHPRMHQRSFVMMPLAEIVPEWYIPEHGRVDEVMFRLKSG